MPVKAQNRSYNVATQNVEYWEADSIVKEVPIQDEIFENSKLDPEKENKANLELQDIMREARKPE